MSSPPPRQQGRHTSRGETLIEVMVAVALMAFVMAPTAMLLETSRRNTLLNRDSLIAEVTAQNGIEVMRIIYGTNRLKFSAQPECWNALPEANVSNCATTKIGRPGSAAVSYTVTQNSATKRWELHEQPQLLPSGRSAADLLADPAAAVYRIEPNFYRSIEVVYPDPDMMEVLSRVEFVSSGKVHSLKLKGRFVKLSS